MPIPPSGFPSFLIAQPVAAKDLGTREGRGKEKRGFHTCVSKCGGSFVCHHSEYVQYVIPLLLFCLISTLYSIIYIFLKLQCLFIRQLNVVLLFWIWFDWVNMQNQQTYSVFRFCFFFVSNHWCLRPGDYSFKWRSHFISTSVSTVDKTALIQMPIVGYRTIDNLM